jgi:hypothetical protein
MPAAPASGVVPGSVRTSTAGDWDSGSLAWGGLPGEVPSSCWMNPGLFRAASPRTGLARFPGIRLSSDSSAIFRRWLSGVDTGVAVQADHK